MKRFICAIGIAALVAIGSASANARDTIRIVGSSTVFPFSTVVAEEFGHTTHYRAPVVESTGSGGGMKLFCEGVGLPFPDITNSSRRMKKSELELCRRNGVIDITEVKIGFDGIVVANSRVSEQLSISLSQLFLALAKEVPIDGELVSNPYVKWSEIDESLPDVEIRVFGPPPTSGTRDAFVELAMEGGAKSFDLVAALQKDEFKRVAHRLRTDGHFIEAGENDNLIVQRLNQDPEAFGIFGFSFLDQNMDTLQGSIIDGVSPTFENIASGDYGVSRSLYFYVKDAHRNHIPGLNEYVSEFTSEKATGKYGYLIDRGLIPLPEDHAVSNRLISLD